MKRYMTTFLLSLIPPSCIIAPNRDIRNINLHSSAFTNSSVQMVFFSPGVVMDINKHSVDNYDDMRERKSSPSNVSSRSALVVSGISSIVYHNRMIINNDLPKQEQVEPIDNFQLLYSSKCQRNNQDNTTTVLSSQGLQHVSNEAFALNTCNIPHVDDNNVINIQLPYDSDQPIEPDLWNSNFSHVSFHGLLEHLLSDTRYIKTSLVCIAKYIKNKKIESSKANNIKYLQGIGEAV